MFSEVTFNEGYISVVSLATLLQKEERSYLFFKFFQKQGCVAHETEKSNEKHDKKRQSISPSKQVFEWQLHILMENE